MPSIQELESALIRADRAGDADSARALAAEIERMGAPSQDPRQARYEAKLRELEANQGPDYNPAEGMSMLERLAVGTGAGASRVYDGVGQIGLQAGEGMGLVPKGRAAEFTREKEAEHAQYEQYASALGKAGKVGDFLGGMVALPIPGIGAGGGLATRIGGAMAMGGLQGGAGFVPEGESRLAHAGGGALAGGVMQGALLEPLRGAATRVVANLTGGASKLPEAAQQAARYAQERGLPIHFDDLSRNPFARAAGVFSDDIPLVGTGGTRQAQADAARRAAEALANRFDTGSNGRLADTLNDSAQAQLSRARGIKDKLYQDAFTGLNALGDFDLPNTKLLANRMIAAEKLKGTLADSSLMTELQRYADAPQFNFEGWHSARSDLGGTIRRRMSGEQAVLSDASTARLRTLKGKMDDELQNVANKTGGTGAAAWRRADAFYRQTMPKYKRGVVADLLRSKNPDAIADRMLGGSDNGGIARQVYTALDRSGRAEVRFALVSKALEKANHVSPDGGDTFSPAVFASELSRMRNRTNAFFSKDEAAELQGLQNYMEHIKRAGQFAANPPTGRRMLMHGLAVGASGAFAPKLAAVYGGAAGASRLLLRTDAGRNLLTALGRTSPESKQAGQIMQAMEGYLQRAAASQASSPTNIEVVGGRPGPAISEEELQRLRESKGLQ